MKDGIDARQGLDERHPVGEVAETVIHVRQWSAKPFRLTVEHARGMSVGQQSIDDMRANETRTAYHEHFHRSGLRREDRVARAPGPCSDRTSSGINRLGGNRRR